MFALRQLSRLLRNPPLLNLRSCQVLGLKDKKTGSLVEFGHTKFKHGYGFEDQKNNKRSLLGFARNLAVGLVAVSEEGLLEESDEDEAAELSSEEEHVENEDEMEAADYLEDQVHLKDVKLDIVEGDKAGSMWLVLDDVFIMHKKQSSANESFWDCSGRRHFNCPAKCSTYEDEEGKVQLGFMYKLNLHECGQTKLAPIMHKFRANLKHEMSTNYKAKFSNVYQQERLKLLKEHQNNPELLERIIAECLRDKKNFRNVAERARNRCFPKLPKTHSEIDLAKLNLKHIELGRSSHPDPEILNKDIILLGTPITAEAWARSEYKSGMALSKSHRSSFIR